MKTLTFLPFVIFFNICFQNNTLTAQQLNLGLSINTGFDRFTDVSAEDRIFQPAMNIELFLKMMSQGGFAVHFGYGYNRSQLKYIQRFTNSFLGTGQRLRFNYVDQTVSSAYTSVAFSYQLKRTGFMLGMQFVPRVKQKHYGSYRVWRSSSGMFRNSANYGENVSHLNYSEFFLGLNYAIFDNIDFRIKYTRPSKIKIDEVDGPRLRLLFGINIYLFTKAFARNNEY